MGDLSGFAFVVSQPMIFFSSDACPPVPPIKVHHDAFLKIRCCISYPGLSTHTLLFIWLIHLVIATSACLIIILFFLLSKVRAEVKQTILLGDIVNCLCLAFNKNLSATLHHQQLSLGLYDTILTDQTWFDRHGWKTFCWQNDRCSSK